MYWEKKKKDFDIKKEEPHDIGVWVLCPQVFII